MSVLGLYTADAPVEMHRQLDTALVPRANVEGEVLSVAQRVEFLVQTHIRLVLARVRP